MTGREYRVKANRLITDGSPQDGGNYFAVLPGTPGTLVYVNPPARPDRQPCTAFVRWDAVALNDNGADLRDMPSIWAEGWEQPRTPLDALDFAGTVQGERGQL